MKGPIKLSLISVFFVIKPAISQVLPSNILDQMDELQNLANSSQVIGYQNDAGEAEFNQRQDISNEIVSPEDEVASQEKESMPFISISKGELELKKFGYDVFKNAQRTFGPAIDIPVPDEYIIGAGDSILVQLFGSTNTQFNLIVNRDGIINFPEIGPILVAGISFKEMRLILDGRIRESMIGVQSSITLGQIRSIRVFVLGDVELPGSYTVGGLSTMTNALFLSGGIADSGSLRRIQLKRNGNIVTELDLYDLLLNGDTSGDTRLLPGDVIFVPPLKSSIALDGAFRKPGIYEFSNNDSLHDIFELVGGLMPNADQKSIKLERIIPGSGSSIVDLDLSISSDASLEIMSGDIIFVPVNPNQLRGVVSLVGNAINPGAYQWRQGMRISDIISSRSMLMPNTDVNYAVIRRESEESGIKVLSFSPELVWKNLNLQNNIELLEGDTIYLFSIDDLPPAFLDALEDLNFKVYIKPPLNEPYIQAPSNHPIFLELSRGENNLAEESLEAIQNQPYLNLSDQAEPFSYMFSEQNDSQDAIEGIEQSGIEQSGREQSERVVDNNIVDKRLITSSKRIISHALISELNNNYVQDSLNYVSVNGSVKSPGLYPYENMMSVSDLIRAGGGFTEERFLDDAEITRNIITEAGVVETELIILSLNYILEDNFEDLDRVLLPGDSLVIKSVPASSSIGFVELSGEVVFPGRYAISSGETLSSLIMRSGGLTSSADVNSSIFLRDTLRDRERNQLNILADQLESQLASLAITGSSSAEAMQAMNVGQSLIAQLRDAEPVGRLVVPLQEILVGDRSDDVRLVDGDALFIPEVSQEVTILGEVQYPTSHFYNPDLNIEDYVDISGGFNQRADEDSIYVVRSNGSVDTLSSQNPFSRSSSLQINPGDTIVVPINISELPALVVWSEVTQILYNIAIAVTAINSM